MSARISLRGADQDLLLYYALAFWSAVLIGGLWSAANWYLSVAALCCLRSGAGFVKGTKQAIGLARTRGGDLGGVSPMVSVLPLPLFAISFLPSFPPPRLQSLAPRSST